MPSRIIAITLHPSKTKSLNITRLKVTLQKLVVEIYGEEATLDFTEGNIGENSDENMIDIKAELSATNMQALETALKEISGLSIAIGNRGEPVRNGVPKAIAQATQEVIESFEKLDDPKE